MNYIKTGLLLSALTATLGVIGYLIGGLNGMYLFLFISILMNMGSYWFSDKIALAASGATPIDESQFPELIADVNQISTKMGIPSPRIYIIPQAQPNAFATGRNPKNSAVAFTAGLLNSLSRDEIRGVAAHELAHIYNRDVLISTIAAVIAGAISSIGNMALWFGLGGDDEDGMNPITMILLIILAPLAATILQLAVSRTREFAADKKAAEVTNQPTALASALERIEEIVLTRPMHVNQAMSSLYIASPIRLDGIQSLFSTHPSTAARVEKLRQMGV